MPIDPRIPQCEHIKVNGLRCGSPSLRGRKYCYFHYSVTRPLIATDIPVLEDAGAVQYSLNRLAEYILEKRIDYKQASLLLWLMQIASSNARNAKLEPFLKEDIVREHPNDRYFRNPALRSSNADAGEDEGDDAGNDGDHNPDSVIAVSQEDLAELERSGEISLLQPSSPSSASPSEGHGFSRAVATSGKTGASAPEVPSVSSMVKHSFPPEKEVLPTQKSRRK